MATPDLGRAEEVKTSDWSKLAMATLTKRQKQLQDYLNNYIGQFGYAPTLQEIGNFFGLSSLATIHKHLKNLEAKGVIKRKWNHSRALEMVDSTVHGSARILRM